MFSKLKIIFPHLIVAHCSVAQLCLTLCDPVDCRPPGSSVKGMLQAGILEWVAISSSRGSLGPRDWTHVSCIAGGFFTTESPGSLPSHCPSLLTPVGSRSLLTSCGSLCWWFDFSEQQPCCLQSLLLRKCSAHQRIPGLRSGGTVSSADSDCPEGHALDSRLVPWIQQQKDACGRLFSALPAPAAFCRGARELSTWLRAFDPRPSCCLPAGEGGPAASAYWEVTLWSLGWEDGSDDPHSRCCSPLLAPLCTHLHTGPCLLPPLSESLDHRIPPSAKTTKACPLSSEL